MFFVIMRFVIEPSSYTVERAFKNTGTFTRCRSNKNAPIANTNADTTKAITVSCKIGKPVLLVSVRESDLGSEKG